MEDKKEDTQNMTNTQNCKLEDMKIKDLKAMVKEKNLIDKFKDKYGRSYAMGSKKQLIELLNEYESNKPDLLKELLSHDEHDESKNEHAANAIANDADANASGQYIEVEIIPEIPTHNGDGGEDDPVNVNNKKSNNTIKFDNEEDTKAMIKVNKYFDRFPWLKKCEYKNRYDPKKLLEEVEMQLSNHNNSNLIADNFILGIGAIETLATDYLPKKSRYFREDFSEHEDAEPLMKLNGLTRVVAANQAIRDTLDELTIKYMDDISLDFITPERRLGLLLLGCCYTTHLINTEERLKQKEKLQNMRNTTKVKNTTKVMNPKFKDL